MCKQQYEKIATTQNDALIKMFWTPDFVGFLDQHLLTFCVENKSFVHFLLPTVLSPNGFFTQVAASKETRLKS